MKWSRIKVFIENQVSKRNLLIKAKAWFPSNPEPDEWLLTSTIPYKTIDLSAKGVFMGAYATLGNKNPRGYKKRGNPRAAFDNFIIYKGDMSGTTYNFYSSSESELEPMLTLSEEQEAIELYEFAYKIGPSNPNYNGFDRMMFLEMLFFREISRWDEAALNVHSLIDLFPESPYTARMGGKDGRTEDDAAIEYAEETTPFHSGDYRKSYTLYERFLENYPNNWRHDIAQYRMIFSLYWMAARDNPKLHSKVIEEINLVLSDNTESIYLDDLVSLLIGTYIRVGDK
jgi:tetratricopeptide (TPR) repeat protein